MVAKYANMELFISSALSELNIREGKIDVNKMELISYQYLVLSASADTKGGK